MFKEFGIRLSFTPVVIGNRVHLKVKPEVSSLDFSNAVALNGFRIPALSTRRTETEIELNDGQTFAIAGLMNNTMNTSMQKIPGIGDIPILGLLFKSKAAQKNSDRAGRDDHAGNSAQQLAGRDAEPAEDARAVPAADHAEGKSPTPPPAFRSDDAAACRRRLRDTTPVARGQDSRRPSGRGRHDHAEGESGVVDTDRRARAQAPLRRHRPRPQARRAAAATAKEREAAERAARKIASARSSKPAQRPKRKNATRSRPDIDARKQKIEDERVARVNHAQAIKDADAAKRQAEQDKEAGEETGRDRQEAPEGNR